MIKHRINKLHKSYLTYNLSRFLQKKIKLLLKKNKLVNFSSQEESEIRAYFSKHGFKRLNIGWHLYYQDKNHLFSPKYIPEDVYYTLIEPSLNRMSFGPAYTDKNILSFLMQNVNQPTVILKNINGFYFKNEKIITKKEAIDICSKLESFVIKPSIDSGGGKKVALVNPVESTKIENILSNYKKNFIIQERIEPNKHLKILNNSSVNTIRVMSYLNDNEISILSSVLRVGSEGQFTDNTGSGGISVGINCDGTLKEVGYDYNGQQYTNTSNQFEFSGFTVPFFDSILDKAKELHPLIPHFRLVSWDFTINSQNEIILIEFNTMLQEINFHQLNNGPLFGEYTEEILKSAKKQEH